MYEGWFGKPVSAQDCLSDLALDVRFAKLQGGGDCIFEEVGDPSPRVGCLGLLDEDRHICRGAVGLQSCSGKVLLKAVLKRLRGLPMKQEGHPTSEESSRLVRRNHEREGWEGERK